MDARHHRGMAGIGVLLAGFALIGAALSGCATGAPAPDVNPDTLNSSAPQTGTTAPSPDSSGGNAVAVQLAALPIGGNTTQDQTTFADTCVTINWIVQQDAAKIPSDVQILITGAHFTSDVYAVADSGCSGGNPACIGFVFDVDHQVCDLAIAATGSQEGSDDPEPAVSIAGTVACLDGQSDGCTSFLQAVANEPSLTIPLDAPQPSQGAGAPPAVGGPGL